MEFTKHCKNPRCRKEFTSTSRNAAYCCSDCQQKHYESRKTARRAYEDNKLSNLLLSATYKVARKIADYTLIPSQCAICKNHVSDHLLEVHHRDLNPFNNNPANLVKLCKKCHTQLHLQLPSVNMVTVLETIGKLPREERKATFKSMVYKKAE